MADQYNNIFILYDWVNFSRFNTKYVIEVSGEDYSADLLEIFFTHANELFSLKNYDAVPLPSLKLVIKDFESSNKGDLTEFLNSNLLDGIEELKKMIGFRLEQLKSSSNKVSGR